MTDPSPLLTRTRNLLIDYFHGDSTALLGSMDPECIWIGLEESTYALSGLSTIRDAIARSFSSRPIGTIAPDVHSVLSVGKITTITHRFYLDTTRPYLGSTHIPYRSSIIWLDRDGKPAIIHGHLSYALSTVEGDEWFPTAAAKANFKILRSYFDNHLHRTVRDDTRFVTKDTAGIWHFIHPMDIVWIESDHNHILLHTQGGDITVNRMIQSALELFSPHLVQIRRDAAVNSHYIQHLDDSSLTLADGSVLHCSGTYLPELARYYQS